ECGLEEVDRNLYVGFEGGRCAVSARIVGDNDLHRRSASHRSPVRHDSWLGPDRLGLMGATLGLTGIHEQLKGTPRGRGSTISRRDASEPCWKFPRLLQTEGAGKAGC